MRLADVVIDVEDSAVVARLMGEIDPSNARAIEQAIALATSNHASRVVVDLSQLDYLDSSGIRLLYQLREQLRIRGQDLSLVVPGTSPSADALRLAGVLDHLKISETVQEALG